MGYYSNVGLVLKKDANAILKAKLLLLDCSGRNKYVPNFLLHNPDITTAKNGDVLYYWRDVKWYEDFPEIQFIEDNLTDFDSNDYQFIRIGEEETDIERQGDYWDNPFGLRVVRDIEWDKA